MTLYFSCLKKEKNNLVRAILGSVFFLYIHPFADGNGRMARLIMNMFFLAGGYPWIILSIFDRKKMFNSLLKAYNEQNIFPLLFSLKKVIKKKTLSVTL